MAMRQSGRFPFDLENALDESRRMANYDWDGDGYCCRRCHRRLCANFDNNSALDQPIKNVRPANKPERMGKNKNTERRGKTKMLNTGCLTSNFGPAFLANAGSFISAFGGKNFVSGSSGFITRRANQHNI